MSFPSVDEPSIKGALFKVSGGGTLYAVIDKPNMLYKTVNSAEELSNVVQLMPRWEDLAGTDWVIPEQIVHRDDPTTKVGYIMRRARGHSLHDFESSPENIPLANVVERVVKAMRVAQVGRSTCHRGMTTRLQVAAQRWVRWESLH